MPTTFSSATLLGLGLSMLAHAWVEAMSAVAFFTNSLNRAYSAHEHSALTAFLSSTPAPSSSSSPSAFPTALPLDIAIETLVSVILLCCGLVAGAEPLRPIRWREWAAEVDHGSLKAPKGARAEDGGKYPSNFDWVEKRRGFVDIRAERKEFADWVRRKDGKGQ